ncbi:MAG: alpha/beta hydrolase [Candidatus Acidiferrum sp.]
MGSRIRRLRRPAQAWGEPGPPPRGLKTSAHELHTLLQAAKIILPYILVGHSWGGLNARMFAEEYPKEVAGMVLVDSTHEDQYLWMNGKIIRPGFLSDEEWSDLTKPHNLAKKAPDQTPTGDATKQDPPPPQTVKLGAPFNKLPPDAQRLRFWATSAPYSKERFEGGDTVDIRSDFIAMQNLNARQ